MGNAAGKLSPCFCHAGDISGRHEIAIVPPTNPLDEGFGHSFCYLRPPESFSAQTTPFLPMISGASVSANASTPLSTSLFDPFFLVSAAFFDSSLCFASVPLQPIPRPLITSGHLPRNPFSIRSGLIERGFLSGPIERGFMSGPIDRSSNLENRGDPCFSNKTGDALPLQTSAKSNRKPNKWSSIRRLKDAILAAISKKTINQNDSVGRSTVMTCSLSSSSSGSGDGNLSSQASLCDENENENGDEGLSMEVSSLQWAQGTAGEDRVHVVVSEENGLVFVGIYDGFNGPDATDFLLSNLYPAVHEELKGVIRNDNETSTSPRRSVYEESRNRASWRRKGKIGVSDEYSGVLEALSEALRKTEEAYLDVADKMLLENPVLSLMGSCVLVMLFVRDDVYLMNVGDSRAVLAKNADPNSFNNDSGNLSALQLTMDHNTLVKEEVQRIKGEHPDDHDAIMNDRVKGSLKVTRAFGAGFLKNPKWNKGLLEMLKIDYVGSSPYITCSPSLHHHRLSPEDKFLILSSDGLYQYFTNEEAVTEVKLFMSSTPEGDPAQHLIEEVLFSAAKKAGMDFHELLDIPQGERRRYHDDVSVIIMSFEGRIWRSSV